METKKRRVRSNISKYKRYAGFILRGYSDEHAAEILNVTTRTLRNWKRTEEFNAIMAMLLRKTADRKSSISGTKVPLKLRRPGEFYLHLYSERRLPDSQHTNTFKGSDLVTIHCLDCGNRFCGNFGVWSTYQTCVSCDKKSFSKGELAVKNVLDRLGVEYIPEAPLFLYSDTLLSARADFSVTINGRVAAIEFDGRQHFESVEFFGGEEKFIDQKQKDWLRDKVFKDRDVPLLRIPYWEFDNIEEIVTNFIDTVK